METSTQVGRPRLFDPDDALDAALALFWEHGYEGTSMAMLIEATSVSAPALYRVFGSKAELFERAVERYQDRHGFGLEDNRPFADAVGDYLRRIAAEFATDPGRGCMVSTSLLTVKPDTAGPADVVHRERDAALATFERRFIDASQRGELPKGVDPAALARALAVIVQGLSVQARDGATPTELRATVDAVLPLFGSEAATTHRGAGRP